MNNKLTEPVGWKLLFPGVNQDAIAIAIAAKMGIHAADSANFAMNAASCGAVRKAVNRKMKAVRRSKQGLADADTVRDAQATMESLRAKEEGRGR